MSFMTIFSEKNLGKLFSEVTPFSTILCDSQNLLCQELYERVRPIQAKTANSNGESGSTQTYLIFWNLRVLPPLHL
jgi:hypothetical protein